MFPCLIQSVAFFWVIEHQYAPIVKAPAMQEFATGKGVFDYAWGSKSTRKF